MACYTVPIRDFIFWKWYYRLRKNAGHLRDPIVANSRQEAYTFFVI